MNDFIELFRLITILLGKLVLGFTVIICLSMLKDMDWNLTIKRGKEDE